MDDGIGSDDRDEGGVHISGSKNFLPLETSVIVSKKLDIYSAIHRLSNRNHYLTLKFLYELGPLTFSSLRSRTNLTTNELNHSLTALRNANIVTKEEKYYALTLFGVTIIESISELQNKLKNFIRGRDSGAPDILSPSRSANEPTENR